MFYYIIGLGFVGGAGTRSIITLKIKMTIALFLYFLSKNLLVLVELEVVRLGAKILFFRALCTETSKNNNLCFNDLTSIIVGSRIGGGVGAFSRIVSGGGVGAAGAV